MKIKLMVLASMLTLSAYSAITLPADDETTQTFLDTLHSLQVAPEIQNTLSYITKVKITESKDEGENVRIFFKAKTFNFETGAEEILGGNILLEPHLSPVLPNVRGTLLQVMRGTLVVIEVRN